MLSRLLSRTLHTLAEGAKNDFPGGVYPPPTYATQRQVFDRAEFFDARIRPHREACFYCDQEAFDRVGYGTLHPTPPTRWQRLTRRLVQWPH
jgi:hypothetical protein